MDDRELMRIRADTLFTYDARGRMQTSNEPLPCARRPAPRLFFGRTANGNVVRFGATLPDDIAGRLETIVGRHAPVNDLQSPPADLASLREALAQHGPIVSETGGPAYRFPATIPRFGGVVRLTAANRELARDRFPWLHDEFRDWQPCFVRVVDGAVVSVCMTSRLAASAAEAGVDTLPEFRGRGYAAAVTAAWGAAIRESGRVPIYSTGWDNLSSQAVARRVGLIMFGADTTIS